MYTPALTETDGLLVEGRTADAGSTGTMVSCGSSCPLPFILENFRNPVLSHVSHS